LSLFWTVINEINDFRIEQTVVFERSGRLFWYTILALYQFRFGVETGNDFRSVKPNPGINPEPSLEPKADPEDKQAIGLKTFYIF
jgi:hypothetical protein